MPGETVEVQVPEPNYTLFEAQRAGMPEVIVVNEALLAFPHPAVFAWHLGVTMEAQDLVDNGMPSRAESALLFDIGDAIEQVVLAGRARGDAVNALFLARSTWNGQRTLMFQVHDPEVAHQALQSLLSSREWPRAWDYRMSQDVGWSEAACLFQLFPLARGHHA